MGSFSLCKENSVFSTRLWTEATRHYIRGLWCRYWRVLKTTLGVCGYGDDCHFNRIVFTCNFQGDVGNFVLSGVTYKALSFTWFVGNIGDRNLPHFLNAEKTVHHKQFGWGLEFRTRAVKNRTIILDLWRKRFLLETKLCLVTKSSK